MKPYYQDDAVTLYHGDCRDVLQSVPFVSLAFADPPYGVGLEYGDAYSDEGGAGYAAWMARLCVDLQGRCDVLFVTPGIRNLWTWPPATWVLAWNKPGSTRRSDLGGFNEWEPVLMYGKRRIYNDAKRLPDCNNHSPGTGDHPCPKPLRLLTWLIAQGCDTGDTVLDPFAGSGTSLVAAKSLGRKAVGIEIEERYCEIIANRLSQGVLDFSAVGPVDVPTGGLL